MNFSQREQKEERGFVWGNKGLSPWLMQNLNHFTLKVYDMFVVVFVTQSWVLNFYDFDLCNLNS